MSKKKILIITVPVLLILISGLLLCFLKIKKVLEISNPLKKESEDTSVSFFKDESGFSFSYPKGIKVNDITPDESEYYSMLSLEKDSSKLTISAKETKEKNIEGWIKGNKEYKDLSLIGAFSLAGISAKQYEKDNKLLTFAVDQNVVYIIESPKDSGFWEKAHNLVVSTFKFADQSGDNDSSASDTDIIYEEEEIVE